MGEPRFARIGVWEGAPEELERWTAQCERVKAGVRSQEGACGAYFLLDRETGRALTLTLWESEEARERSEAFRARSQDTTAERSGARASTERYDVVDSFGPARLTELELTHGSEPPPRTNDLRDQRIVVAEGRVRCRIGEQTVDAGTGDVIMVPRGTAHAFTVEPSRAPHLDWHPAGYRSGTARVVYVD